MIVMNEVNVLNEEKRAYKVILQIIFSVLAAHLPIQLTKRYGEKMCFVKHHVSEGKCNRLVECKRCITLVHTMDPHVILMLHLSVGMYIKGKTCRKLQVMDIFCR